MVEIEEVTPRSPAAKAGIKSGDTLVAINGNEINDYLDYRFYITEKNTLIKYISGGREKEAQIKKDEYSDIGLNFKTYLMSDKKRCSNKCIFCFVDQLPKGLRETLYFKDDDSRLSFLMGNYVTLTNLSKSDVDRIIKMKLSPINVSVHTTNPELRVMMTGNKSAGMSLDYLQKLAEAGIGINGQIVLCRGINDGKELEDTMHSLAILHPSIKSVSVVPAGLTKHREGLYPLSPYTKEEAGEIVKQVESFASACKKFYGQHIFFAADELYIKAGIKVPDEEYYEGYAQIENGVGMLRSTETEFDDEFAFIAEYDLEKKRELTIATAGAAYDLISSLAQKLAGVSESLTIRVENIENKFFGESVTVSGLMTGIDLYNHLKEVLIGERLLLPVNCTESTNSLFLDGMTVEELEKKLNTKIVLVGNGGREFIKEILY